MTGRRTLTDSERLAWLRLARTESVGPASFAALIARFGNAREALKEAPPLRDAVAPRASCVFPRRRMRARSSTHSPSWVDG